MTQTEKRSPFTMNVDLMHGPIFKSLVVFMLPIFVSNLFQQLYNTVDTMIVGNVLGDTALAAIGSCGSIYELLVGFGIGIGNGLAIVAARSYGAQDEDLLKRTVVGSVVIGLIASLVITTAGFFGLHALLQLLDTPAEILEDAYSYIIVIDLGVVVMFMYNLCAGLLRAIGNSVMPLVFLLISSVLNVGLDLLFIMVFRWGVAGAAIATVAAQLISTVACFIYAFAKYPQLRLHREDMQITRGDIRRHVVQGVPLGLQFSVLAIGIIVMQSVVVQFDMLDGVMVSSSAQMGFGAANKLFNLTATPMNALGTAMTSFTAQNLGAGNHDRIRKGALQSLVMVSLLAAMAVGIGLLLTLGNAYLRIFLSADKITMDTVRYGNTFLYVDYAMYLFLGFIFVVRNCVQGIGRSRFVLGAGAAELVARIAVCLTLPAAVAGGVVSAQANPLAFYALCAADPMAWIAADIVLAIPFFRNILRRDYRYMNI